MKQVILLKYGEIVLKGLNRGFFEKQLVRRLRRILEHCPGEYSLDYAQSTMSIRGKEGADIALAYEKTKKIFGVVSVCLAYECEKDIEEIKVLLSDKAAELIGEAKSFRITAKRSDKRFPLTSPEISAECGQVILEKMPDMQVDVHSPQVNIFIEVRDRSAFVHSGGEKGAGGMPSGSNGRAVLLLSGGIDSPVAGYMTAKRGVDIDAVYFETPPFTGEGAREKVIALAEKLSEYCGVIYLHRISVTEVQKEIMDKCDPRNSTLLLRRFMMRIAERVAEGVGARALITGESIGQVASQTLDSLFVTNEVVNMPVFRPCSGLDKEEIVVRARQIGTFETSGQPYDDCCSLFTPKHPNTRPTSEQMRTDEEKLDIDSLVERALATDDRIKISKY